MAGNFIQNLRQGLVFDHQLVVFPGLVNARRVNGAEQLDGVVLDQGLGACIDFECLLLVFALRRDARFEHAQHGCVARALDHKPGAQRTHVALRGVHDKRPCGVVRYFDQHLALQQLDTSLLGVEMQIYGAGTAERQGGLVGQAHGFPLHRSGADIGQPHLRVLTAQ